MKKLLLVLLLLSAPLLAKEPWPRGHIVYLASNDGSWAASFELDQLKGPWAIFDCACDVPDLVNVRVALRRAGANIKNMGQLLISSGKSVIDDDGDESRTITKLRYLGSDKSETLNGLTVIVLYFEIARN